MRRKTEFNEDSSTTTTDGLLSNLSSELLPALPNLPDIEDIDAKIAKISSEFDSFFLRAVEDFAQRSDSACFQDSTMFEKFSKIKDKCLKRAAELNKLEQLHEDLENKSRANPMENEEIVAALKSFEIDIDDDSIASKSGCILENYFESISCTYLCKPSLLKNSKSRIRKIAKRRNKKKAINISKLMMKRKRPWLFLNVSERSLHMKGSQGIDLSTYHYSTSISQNSSEVIRKFCEDETEKSFLLNQDILLIGQHELYGQYRDPNWLGTPRLISKAHDRAEVKELTKGNEIDEMLRLIMSYPQLTKSIRKFIQNLLYSSYFELREKKARDEEDPFRLMFMMNLVTANAGNVSTGTSSVSETDKSTIVTNEDSAVWIFTSFEDDLSDSKTCSSGSFTNSYGSSIDSLSEWSGKLRQRSVHSEEEYSLCSTSTSSPFSNISDHDSFSSHTSSSYTTFESRNDDTSYTSKERNRNSERRRSPSPTRPAPAPVKSQIKPDPVRLIRENLFSSLYSATLHKSFPKKIKVSSTVKSPIKTIKNTADTETTDLNLPKTKAAIPVNDSKKDFMGSLDNARNLITVSDNIEHLTYGTTTYLPHQNDHYKQKSNTSFLLSQRLMEHDFNPYPDTNLNQSESDSLNEILDYNTDEDFREKKEASFTVGATAIDTNEEDNLTKILLNYADVVVASEKRDTRTIQTKTILPREAISQFRYSKQNQEKNRSKPRNSTQMRKQTTILPNNQYHNHPPIVNSEAYQERKASDHVKHRSASSSIGSSTLKANSLSKKKIKSSFIAPESPEKFNAY